MARRWAATTRLFRLNILRAAPDGRALAHWEPRHPGNDEMTRRLYYDDSYLTNFAATVVGTDGTKVYLDQTAFYPTSGGQPFDSGELNGANVTDVIDEDSRIAHVLSSPATFAVGATVNGRVQWTRRFDHMQQHTGQHLLSAVFADLFGHETVSVHFGDQSSTLVSSIGLNYPRASQNPSLLNVVFMTHGPSRRTLWSGYSDRRSS